MAGPVARVLVDTKLAHLDRLFDYAVPPAMDAKAVPGARVKVRFAGQDLDGYIVERADSSDHDGVLAPLRRVVSDEVVLHPQIVELADAVAHRYAGSRSDVLRLAIPPRNASVEAVATPASKPHDWSQHHLPGLWTAYEGGHAFQERLWAGESPRTVLHAAPGEDWPVLIAQAAAATLGSGRGVLVCVPDNADVDRVDAAFTAVFGDDQHVVLRAEDGPARRYHEFLAVSRGAVRAVIGTRSAVWAPVKDLGLIVVWDGGDDLFAEPRAPYPKTRDVALLRATTEDAAIIVGGFTVSPEDTYLFTTGFAPLLAASRETVRARVTTNVVGGYDYELNRDPYAHIARLPHEALTTIKNALATGVKNSRGPVLVQTWRLANDERTIEEFGRVFPGVRVVASYGGKRVAEVPNAPALVLATPGAEPVTEFGYPAVVILDARFELSREGLRTEEEALRRWSNAVGLVAHEGVAMIVGDPDQSSLQALVRWDQSGWAEREVAHRAEARMPPAARAAIIDGSEGALADAMTLFDRPAHADVLGPVPVPDSEDVRLVLRVPRAEGGVLSKALRDMQRLRSARKLDAVRVEVDPVVLE